VSCSDDFDPDGSGPGQAHPHSCTLFMGSLGYISYAGTKMFAGVALQDSMWKGYSTVISVGLFPLESPLSKL
jgi:hypothetical protein